MLRGARLFLFAAIVALTAAQTVHAKNNGALVLEEMGMFFVGGEEIDAPYPGTRNVPVEGETITVNQALVHYLIPKAKNQRLPVVMVPGLSLTSYTYMATPDGREGWAQIFARKGFPVYVFDDPGNAVSGGWDINPINAATVGDAPAEDQPDIATWTNETIWERWRIGSERDVPYDNVRYPVDQIDQLYSSITPRISVPESGRFGSILKAEVLTSLLDKIGPVILMVHSSAGYTASHAIDSRPDLIKALIVVEPVIFQRTFPWEKVSRLLGIFGDSDDGRLPGVQEIAQQIQDNGGVGDVIVLDQLGIEGNTHLMMQDDNNEEIAEMILRWIKHHVDTK